MYERNATDSPSLHLPPELRNRIYSYVLGGNIIAINDHPLSGNVDGLYDVLVARYPSVGLLPKETVEPDLQFLATSRQVYSEARMLPLLLAEL